MVVVVVAVEVAVAVVAVVVVCSNHAVVLHNRCDLHPTPKMICCLVLIAGVRTPTGWGLDNHRLGLDTHRLGSRHPQVHNDD